MDYGDASLDIERQRSIGGGGGGGVKNLGLGWDEESPLPKHTHAQTCEPKAFVQSSLLPPDGFGVQYKAE